MRFLGGLTSLALSFALAGCACKHFRFVAIVEPEEFQVVSRTWQPHSHVWTTWPFPEHYELVRESYRVWVDVNRLGTPHVNVQAYDRDDERLAIRGPNNPLGVGPRIGPDVEEGSWGFEVLRGDEVLGDEYFRYEIESRLISCAYDVP